MTATVVSERQKMINRITRKLALIEENAKQATPGPWSISHSHVVKYHKRGEKDFSYDIAAQPWEKKMCVFDVSPYANGSRDMRYIATCDPKSMLELIADVRKLLEELPSGVDAASPEWG